MPDVSYPAVVSQSPGQDKSRMSRWEHILSSDSGNSLGSYLLSLITPVDPKTDV